MEWQTGLFSAAVTAFCVEAFRLLSQEPADSSNALLLVISKQLADPSSPPADDAIGDTFSASRHDVQTNVLYFVSLSLALSVSAMCILGKQWIREYQRDTPGSSCDAVRVRQARFDALEAWKLPEMMASLPVILLVALILFFTGLLGQLWHASDKTTAAIVSLVAGMTALVVIFTTIVPAHWSQERLEKKFTPFRSPQAMIYLNVYQRMPVVLPRLYQLAVPIYKLWKRTIAIAARLIPKLYHSLSGLLSSPARSSSSMRFPLVKSWADIDNSYLVEELRKSDQWYRPVTSVHRALRWISEVYRNASDLEVPFMWCLQSEYHPPSLISNSWAYGLEGLGEYVLGDSMRGTELASQDDFIYTLSCAVRGSSIASSRGLFQAEMCIRSIHRVLDTLSQYGFQDSKPLWARLTHLFRALWRTHRVFDDCSTRKIREHHLFPSNCFQV